MTQRVSSASRPTSPLPWWVAAIVIIGSLLMAAGAVIALARPAMLVSAGDDINGAVNIYAGYLASRNLAVAFLLVAALLMRARGALWNFMILTAVIQFLDAGIDSVEGRWAVVPGVLVLGIAFLMGAGRLSRERLWKVSAWRDE